MAQSARITFVLTVVVIYITGTTGQDGPCSQTNRASNLQTCLSSIRERAVDDSYFWFGSSYATRCPPALRFTFNCLTLGLDTSVPNSLSSMTFDVPSTDLTGLDRYVDVKFTSQPGTYTYCDYVHNQTDTVELSVDPVSNTSHQTWLLRGRPEVTWTAGPSDLFTLIVVDVGHGFLHGLFVNVPGSNLSQSDIVKDYHGPRNTRELPNVYAFVLYKQSGRVNADSISIIPGTGLNVTQFAEQHQIGNLVGLSWMEAYYDAYAMQLQAATGFLKFQNCASLVANALTSANHPARPFLPADPALGVYLRLRLTTDAITFPCGVEERTQGAADFYADPIGSPFINTAVARTGSTQTYTMEMNKNMPNNSVDFAGKLYSLVHMDPDVPYAAVGSNQRPLLHGLIVNIQGADVTSGMVVQPYLGPGPPDNMPHYYYHLLYEQSQQLQVNTTDYTNTCSETLAGRCQFNVDGFVSSNNLTLVGATWLKATTDEYITCRGVSAGPSAAPTAYMILCCLSLLGVALNMW